MLLCRNTPKGAGCILCGDYWDLNALHDTVSAIAAGAPWPEELGNYLFAFAYEIRKASTGDREKITLGYDHLDQVAYRGCRQIWPSYLFGLALLRSSAAWVSTSRLDQANLSMLEATTYAALVAAGADADYVMQWVAHFQPTKEYLGDWVTDANHRYIYGRQRGKRISRLSEILLTLYETSAEYQEFSVTMRRAAMREDCKPNDLTVTRDWPRFRW